MNENIPRGIRNNNPGNIRHNVNNRWVGLSPCQNDKDFCVFISAKYGIRALSIILRNYQSKYGLKTVKEIINRYAPLIENNTNSYVKSVCQFLGITDNTPINVEEEYIMLCLLKAIIRHENGIQPYSNEELLEGIRT